VDVLFFSWMGMGYGRRLGISWFALLCFGIRVFIP